MPWRGSSCTPDAMATSSASPRCPRELRELLGLFGLADVLRFEMVRQPEEREEGLGVEEERQLGDEPA